MRVVLDTVVWLRALIRPQSQCGRIIFQHYQHITILISTPILIEILNVLTRSELTARFPQMSALPNLQTILGILAKAEAVEPNVRVSLPRDPKDEKFLECAITGIADFIVSEDKDLLSLREYQGIAIVSCSEMLAMLQAN
ncbi:MAG: PilT protein domain protein [Dehalococcoidia bacterium]|nr:PilT protein domain protein [Dehalococcoidia bacterium]